MGEGKTGNIGSEGEPITLPPAGVGPAYEVFVVTLPETIPPPTMIFPFTSILPPRLALEPTERMVPATADEFEAAILPVTVLLLARRMVPLL